MQLPATPRFIHALGLNGVFVTGWCKRGPKGDIGSNLSDAAETAASVMQWHQAQQQQQKADLPDYGRTSCSAACSGCLKKAGIASMRKSGD